MKYVQIEITQGNLNNGHIYLSSVIEFFPANAIGGPNESDVAQNLLQVHNGLGEPVLTDIAGDKKIFRKRSWVSAFFHAHDIKEGDFVIIERTDHNRYHLYPKRV